MMMKLADPLLRWYFSWMRLLCELIGSYLPIFSKSFLGYLLKFPISLQYSFSVVWLFFWVFRFIFLWDVFLLYGFCSFRWIIWKVLALFSEVCEFLLDLGIFLFEFESLELELLLAFDILDDSWLTLVFGLPEPRDDFIFHFEVFL